MNYRSIAGAALLGLGLTSNLQPADSTALTVKAIAAAGTFNLAVASDGTVWQWGGAAGSTPVRVTGLSSIAAVSTSASHSLALRDDGTVWAWGDNSSGQLGDGTTTSRETPVQVTGLSGAVAVEAGAGQSLALLRDGTVSSWGQGGPSWSAWSPPAPVTGLNSVTGIASVYGLCLAVKTDGTVWWWGVGSSPSRVSGLSGVTKVALAGNYGQALKADGTVWEWQLQTQYSSTPAQVPDLTGVLSLANQPAFPGHRVVLKRDGTVWAWGRNDYGQLGNGAVSTIYEPSRPVQVSGLTGVTAIATGSYHCLALKNDGTLWAWGQNLGGQLGDGALLRRPVPARVSGLGGVVAAAAGQQRGLTLKSDGAVWEWGTSYGTPEGGITWLMAPAEVGVLTDVKAIAAGWQAVALKRDGTVWTWPGPNPSLPVPSPIAGLDGIAAISGTDPVLAAKRDGTVLRLLGYPPAPAQVPGLSGIVAVAGSSLALKDDWTVWQFGSPYEWYCDTPCHPEPAHVAGLTGITAIASGDIQAALRNDGTVWEWDGRAMPGQRSGLDSVVGIAVGADHSLAVKRDGTVWAWGWNDSGQLGEGTTTARATPVQVAGLTEVAAVTAGTSFSMALKRDGTVWAWGQNGQGQLGDDRAAYQPAPVQVTPLGDPDLAIAMSHERDFTAGDQAAYTLTITNTGRTASAGAITVTDTLPPGLAYVRAPASDGACSAAGQIVTCSMPGPLEPGETRYVWLVVEVSSAACPGVTNLATVSNASDRNPSNNAVGEPTVVLPQGEE